MFGIKTNSLFGETKKLEREIDEFVDIDFLEFMIQKNPNLLKKMFDD